MFDPASRFRLVQEATMAPAVCLVTKTDKGPFVDTGMELNKFDPIWAEVNLARIYLSVDVVREMAEGAGLFDEVRERAAEEIASAHSLGHNEGVMESGELVHAADRLSAALGRLGHVGDVGASEPSSSQGDEGPDPLVLVTDGREHRDDIEGVTGTDREHRAPAGQGNGARRQRRAVGVPSDSGDGDNPFRI